MARNRVVLRASVGLVSLAMSQGLVAAVGPASARAIAAGEAATTVKSVKAQNAKKAPCQRPARGFVPNRAKIAAIGRTVRVIQVKRTKDGAVGAGPTTEAGKWLMAMDPETRPSSRRGSVLLSGHTWPDGSALGNAMLKNLRTGHNVVLAGKNGKRACYRITERTQYRNDDVPRNRAFRYWGSEQLVIVTCSGKRISPGNWSHRTIWYAKPVIPKKTAAPAPSNPPSEEKPPNLLGGLLGGLFG